MQLFAVVVAAVVVCGQQASLTADGASAAAEQRTVGQEGNELKKFEYIFNAIVTFIDIIISIYISLS